MSDKHVGRLVGRYLKSMILAGDGEHAAQAYVASQRWLEGETLQRVLQKSAVAANSTDLSIAQAPVGQDLLALVNSVSILGRMRGFRMTPANTAVIAQTGRSTAYWVGEGAPIPLSAAAFSRSQLAEQKLAAMAVVTNELARSSSPSAEATMARDLAEAVARKLDETFVDPTNAGSPEESPASVTRYAPQFTSTGTSVALIDTDLRLLMDSLTDGGSDLQFATWIMSPRSASYLSSLRGSGGSPCYPQMGALGGQLFGLPAITSAAVTRSGSPSEGAIHLIDGSRVWLVNENRVTISVAKHTSVQMDDSPTNNSVVPTGTTTVSLFQTDSMAIKAVQYVNWAVASAASAAASLVRVNF